MSKKINFDDAVPGIPPYESLTIKSDFVFSKVMSVFPDNCRDFLTRAFPELDIGSVEVVRESTHQATIDSKGVRFDVYATDGSYLFDLEMRTTDQKYLPLRSRYYNAVLDTDQVYTGGDYVKIKPVFILFICTFELPYGNRHRYTFCRYDRDDRNIAMDDKTEIILLTTKGTADDLDEPMRRFLDYVDGKPGAEDGDEFIRRLDQGVKNVRMNKEWKREYMELQIMIKHREQEAAEKAVADEKKRIVTRMIEDGNFSDDQIMNITGTTVQEIEECRQRVNRK